MIGGGGKGRDRKSWSGEREGIYGNGCYLTIIGCPERPVSGSPLISASC
jgi:hypothetical protein